MYILLCKFIYTEKYVITVYASYNMYAYTAIICTHVYVYIYINRYIHTSVNIRILHAHPYSFVAEAGWSPCRMVVVGHECFGHGNW